MDLPGNESLVEHPRKFAVHGGSTVQTDDHVLAHAADEVVVEVRLAKHSVDDFFQGRPAGQVLAIEERRLLRSCFGHENQQHGDEDDRAYFNAMHARTSDRVWLTRPKRQRGLASPALSAGELFSSRP